MAWILTAAIFLTAVVALLADLPEHPVPRSEPPAVGAARPRSAETTVRPPPTSPATVVAEPEPEALPDEDPPSLAYEREPVVTGSLVDEAGRPIPSALLSLGIPGQWDDRSVRGSGTARDGVFRFTLHGGWIPAPGMALFVVEAPGYLRERVPATEEVCGALERDGSYSGLRVALRRCAVVEGFVFGVDGQPAQDAGVGWTRSPFERLTVPGLSVGTDERGHFVLDGLDPARGGYLLADKGTAISRAVQVEGRLSCGATTTQDLHLEATSAVAVTVVFLNARAGLKITTDYGPHVEGSADRDFTVETRSGQHVFRLSDPADPSWTQEIEFEIPHGAREHTLAVEVARPAPER